MIAVISNEADEQKSKDQTADSFIPSWTRNKRLETLKEAIISEQIGENPETQSENSKEDINQ